MADLLDEVDLFADQVNNAFIAGDLVVGLGCAGRTEPVDASTGHLSLQCQRGTERHPRLEIIAVVDGSGMPHIEAKSFVWTNADLDSGEQKRQLETWRDDLRSRYRIVGE